MNKSDAMFCGLINAFSWISSYRWKSYFSCFAENTPKIVFSWDYPKYPDSSVLEEWRSKGLAVEPSWFPAPSCEESYNNVPKVINAIKEKIKESGVLIFENVKTNIKVNIDFDDYSSWNNGGEIYLAIINRKQAERVWKILTEILGMKCYVTAFHKATILPFAFAKITESEPILSKDQFLSLF